MKKLDKEKVVKLLSQLIEIYSPYFHEEEAMNFTYNWLLERNIPAKYHKYSEKKVTGFDGINIIGSIKGKENGPKVYLNGHLDTVSICEGWTKNPLKATIEGDKLYGLGSLDMKGGVCAIMLALEAFLNEHKDFNGEIIYSFVSDEEGPFGLGTDALILNGITNGVDCAIVPEPSSGFCGLKFPCLCLGARGGYNYTVTFQGKSSHAATPELGINAIIDASKVLIELEKTELIEDDKLGKGSICIIDAKGGGAACSTADTASFTVFRHIVRGEDQNYIREEINRAVERAGIKSKVKMEFRDSPHEEANGFMPYITDENNIYTREFQESIKRVTGEYGKVAYFSSIGDFNYLGSRVKVPTFIFGPSGNNFHSADEWVSIDSVVKTSNTIYDYLVNLLCK